jgi:hypothetical protein
MFSIKGRHYKVEYEGLHLLCLNCGKFGHYKEGCEVKECARGGGVEVRDENGEPKESSKTLAASDATGPWMVVQKTRRPRRVKEAENTAAAGVGVRVSDHVINHAAADKGSRFIALSKEVTEIEVFNDENQRDAVTVDSQRIIQIGGANQGKKKEGTIKGKSSTFKKSKAAPSNGRDLSSVTRGLMKEKKRSGPGAKFKEGISDMLDNSNVEEFISNQSNNLKLVGSTSGVKVNGIPISQVGTQVPLENKKNNKLEARPNAGGVKPSQEFIPHPPRPPNMVETTATILHVISKEKNNEEKEEFEDADDHGISGAEDLDMEIVEETPGVASLGGHGNQA